MDKQPNLALIDLFASGLHWLHYLEKSKECARYSVWKKLMETARANDSSIDNKKLMWLWEAITSEPDIKSRLFKRILSIDDEWKEIKPIECLPSNSSFGIFFRGFQAFGYPAFKQIEGAFPDAEAEILEPLLLRPGKAQRLECCDVQTILRIKIPEKLSADQEALAFKVDEKDITICEDSVEVAVKSLNHAYTKASLRLQSHRRGHGGMAYNHIALRVGDKLYEPLEEVRKKNEKHIWLKLTGE